MDYRRFAASQTNDFLNEQCLLIKKYAKNQWVTTNYIPNYDEGHIGGSPSLDFQSYTRYMVYGDNEGIGRRGYRVGNPLRIAWANDFFRPIQGTYGVMELQPGQVNWGSINPQPLPGAVRLWSGVCLPVEVILSAPIVIANLFTARNNIITELSARTDDCYSRRKRI